MSNHFFAVIARMKYINRWGLMRNIRDENLSEHAQDVAIIAHALAVIRNKRFNGTLNCERAALLALYHDTPEILTGDLPTPVKYFDPDIQKAYKKVEKVASKRLLSMLPHDLREEYEPIFIHCEQDAYLWQLVKAADKLSALIKCMDEEKAGNQEFSNAGASLREKINAMDLPEVRCFVEEFLPSFGLTLDEHTKG